MEVPERAVTVQICASERRNVSPDVCVSNLALTSVLTFKKKVLIPIEKPGECSLFVHPRAIPSPFRRLCSPGS